MSCKDHENDLLPFLDRRLDAAGVARVESHLRECAACRKDVEGMRATWKLLGYYPGRNASAQLPARLLEAARVQLEVEKRWTHRLRRHLPIVASVAAVLLVAIVTMVLGPGRASVTEYDRVLAQVPSDERGVVENLDLVQNLDTVQNMDVLEDDQAVEYLDIVKSITDEDF